MSAKLTLTGVDELRAEFRRLTRELAGEGGKIAEGHANRATSAIKSGYPFISGDLRDKTTVTHTQGPVSAKSVIKNTSKYARVFETGSNVRHYVTVNGKQHVTGRMPANHLFTREVMRARRAMYGDLKDLLVRHGMTVTGDVG